MFTSPSYVNFSATNVHVIITRALLSFTQVHVQSPKPLEIVLSNSTLVDAVWAVAGSGEKPRYLSLPPSEKVTTGLVLQQRVEIWAGAKLNTCTAKSY